MANISTFYPVGRQGLPLGLNAAGGDLGVATGQLLLPLVVIPLTGLPGAGLAWVPLIIIATVGAWFGMDNLATARAAFDRRDLARVFRTPHTWVMSILYIGTFGSFIGYSFTFPRRRPDREPGRRWRRLEPAAAAGDPPPRPDLKTRPRDRPGDSR